MAYFELCIILKKAPFTVRLRISEAAMILFLLRYIFLKGSGQGPRKREATGALAPPIISALKSNKNRSALGF